MKKKRAVTLGSMALVLVILCSTLALFGRAKAAEPISLPILMYHHIHKSPKYWGKYTVSPETFAGDMKYLKEHGYTAVTTAELLAYVEEGKALPKKPVMITFDDGQLSFAEYAMPVLEQYDMKAIVAIVGAYAEQYTKTLDRNVNYAHMTWADLKKLSQTGRVEVASHTYNMHSLKAGRKGCRINTGEDPAAYQAAFLADVQKNDQLIADAIGIRPVAFAYPYGYFCDEAREVLAQEGYRVLFTCTERVNQLTGDPEELLDLCRFNRPNDVNRATFFAQFD